MSNLAGEILILTGPPGSGKTTLAAILASLPGAPKAHLHADDFWRFIKTGAIAPFLPQAHEQNRAVMNVLAGACEGYSQGGLFVVLDGVIGPWFLEPFRKLSPHYIVLRPPLDEAIRRCAGRSGDQLSDPETIAALHRQFAPLDGFERHVIDTAGQAPQDTLRAVTSALQSGAYRLAP